jgi:hypothetical protein
MRAIRNDDLWAAARGLRMGRLPVEALDALIATHEKLAGSMFASAVIAEAARQFKLLRRVRP